MIKTYRISIGYCSTEDSVLTFDANIRASLDIMNEPKRKEEW